MDLIQLELFRGNRGNPLKLKGFILILYGLNLIASFHNKLLRKGRKDFKRSRE